MVLIKQESEKWQRLSTIVTFQFTFKYYIYIYLYCNGHYYRIFYCLEPIILHPIKKDVTCALRK